MFKKYICIYLQNLKLISNTNKHFQFILYTLVLNFCCKTPERIASVLRMGGVIPPFLRVFHLGLSSAQEITAEFSGHVEGSFCRKTPPLHSTMPEA